MFTNAHVNTSYKICIYKSVFACIHKMQECINPANAAFLGASNLNVPFV